MLSIVLLAFSLVFSPLVAAASSVPSAPLDPTGRAFQQESSCAGDESMTFNPNPPIAGQSFTITVSSSEPLSDVGLTGPGNPRFNQVTRDGDKYLWSWTANVDTAGQQDYSFTVDEESCASGSTVVHGGAASASACFGDERMTYSPATPFIDEPLNIEVTSSQAHTNVGLQGTSPAHLIGIGEGGEGTIWKYQITPAHAGLNQYDFMVDGVSCTSLTIPIHRDTSGEH